MSSMVSMLAGSGVSLEDWKFNNVTKGIPSNTSTQLFYTSKRVLFHIVFHGDSYLTIQIASHDMTSGTAAYWYVNTNNSNVYWSYTNNTDIPTTLRLLSESMVEPGGILLFLVDPQSSVYVKNTGGYLDASKYTATVISF